MKTFVIAPFVPWPLDQGGSIRMFNLVRELARYHDVTLACLSDRENPDFGPLSTCCREVYSVRSERSFCHHVAGFLLGGNAYNMCRFASPVFHRLLAGLAVKERYDLLVVEYSYLWQYAGHFPGAVKLLDAHNMEYAIVRQLGRACANPLKRLLYTVEERRLKRGEEEAWNGADWCLAVSAEEQSAIAAAVVDPGKVLCLPNGVDLERFAFRGAGGGGEGILLLGGMEYQPNLDAAQYFFADILPLIRNTLPTVPVQVVGRGLHLLREWESAGQIYFHESVPDVRPWLSRCDLLAVPLRFGAGTRIKILEAMATGIPVVATTKGCEGIGVSTGEHLLVGDGPEQFAGAVCRLIADRPEALRRAVNARCLIERQYGWDGNVRRVLAEIAREEATTRQGAGLAGNLSNY